MGLVGYYSHSCGSGGLGQGSSTVAVTTRIFVVDDEDLG